MLGVEEVAKQLGLPEAETDAMLTPGGPVAYWMLASNKFVCVDDLLQYLHQARAAHAASPSPVQQLELAVDPQAQAQQPPPQQ